MRHSTTSSARPDGQWDGDAERLRGLEVDSSTFVTRLDRRSAGFSPLRMRAGIGASEAVSVDPPATITLQSTNGDDFDLAGEFLRRYETGLRAGDALHLAIASNNRATALYTLDKMFLTAGRRLGLKVMAGIRLQK